MTDIKKKTVFFHCGFPKTGTTTLQYFLKDNRELLKKYGVLYPNIDYLNKIVPYGTIGINGLFLSKGALMQAGICENQEEIIEYNIAKILKSSCNKIIISGETIICDIEETKNLLRFKKDFEVKIIVYPRKSIEYISSLYQTSIRIGNHLRVIDDYLENDGLYTLYDNLFYLGEEFGDENIIVHPYEREKLKNNNIIDDFMSIILDEFDEINSAENFIFQDNLNKSMNRYEAEFINVINKLSFKSTDKTNLPWRFQIIEDLVDMDSAEPRIVNTLSKSQVVKICEKYDDVEKNTAKRFLDQENLFSEKYTDLKDEDYEEFTDFTNKQVLEYVIRFIDYRFNIFFQLQKQTRLKKIRRSLFQIRLSKNEKIVKLFGIIFFHKKNNAGD